MLIFILFVVLVIIGAFRASPRIGSYVLSFVVLAVIACAWQGGAMWYSRHFGARARIHESFSYRPGAFLVSIRNDSDKTITGLRVTCGHPSETAPDIAPHTSYAGRLAYGEELNRDHCWLDYETVTSYGADTRAQDRSAINNPSPPQED